MNKIIFIGIALFLLGCQPQTCRDFVHDYIEENNLTIGNLYFNNQGYWWVEKDGEELTNCLEDGGKVSYELDKFTITAISEPIRVESCKVCNITKDGEAGECVKIDCDAMKQGEMVIWSTGNWDDEGWRWENK